MPIQLQGLMSTITFLDIIDIAVVAFLLYKMYIYIKDTRAMVLLKGLLVLLAITLISNWVGLNVINWIMQKILTVLFVALPIVFQPELRRTLEHIGRGKFFGKTRLNKEEAENLLNELDKTVTVLSQNKIGALIVLERESVLNDYSDTGIKIDGIVSSEFLINVFIPNTPLHDGAAILRGNRMTAAGCLLPLTEDRSLSKELGTRHRAALGLSEQTDAVIIVVSEETGIISVARAGRLVRHLDSDKLKQLLRPLFTAKPSALNDLYSNKKGDKLLEIKPVA